MRLIFLTDAMIRWILSFCRKTAIFPVLPKPGRRQTKAFIGTISFFWKNPPKLQDKLILDEISGFISDLHFLWKELKFQGIEIYFCEDGTWGFLPITSLGVHYQSKGVTPSWIHNILYGDAPFELPFMTKVRTQQKELCTLQAIIDYKLPDLDDVNTGVLHRKAVVHYVLGMLLKQCLIQPDSVQCQAHMNGRRFLKIFSVSNEKPNQ